MNHYANCRLVADGDSPFLSAALSDNNANSNNRYDVKGKATDGDTNNGSYSKNKRSTVDFS
jgi:hypothetical protein